MLCLFSEFKFLTKLQELNYILDRHTTVRTWSAGWDWWAGFVRKDLHHLVKELERRTEEDTDDGDEDQQKYVVPRGHPRTIVGAVKSSLSPSVSGGRVFLC